MRRSYFWTLILAIIIGVICYYVNKRCPGEITFWISLIGGLASLVGITFTLIELHNTKKVADLTQQAVNENNKYVKTVMNAAKIADSIRLAEEIEAFLTNKKFGEACLKMQECQKILITIKNSEYVKPFIEYRSYNLILQKLGVNIKSIIANKSEHPEQIDANKVVEDLLDLRIVLTEVSSKMENDIGNGTK